MCPTAPAAGARLGCPAFTVATIRPAALLDERFLQDYIRRGALYVMTTGAGSDRHNTLCIAGGLLHLTVDAETYSQLGLLGRASGVHPRRQFFRVQVNLRGQGFRPSFSASFLFVARLALKGPLSTTRNRVRTKRATL